MGKGKNKSFRFGWGSLDAPMSDVWQFAINKDDVYIGSAKVMRLMKMSLHKSGVWLWSMTEQSGKAFENGNRRSNRWERPPQHASGITRGPSILVPHTSISDRQIAPEVSRTLLPDSRIESIFWGPKPDAGQVVEFSFYFVEKGRQLAPRSHEVAVAERTLASGHGLVLLYSVNPAPPEYLSTVEQLIRENPFQVDELANVTGRFTWISTSTDAMRIPIVTDMPAPFQKRIPPAMIIGAAGHNVPIPFNPSGVLGVGVPGLRLGRGWPRPST